MATLITNTAPFAAEHIEIGDVEADILTRNWGIEMMRHSFFAF